MVLDLFTCLIAVGPLLRLCGGFPPKILRKTSKFGQKSAEPCMRLQGPFPKKANLLVILHDTLEPQKGQKVPNLCWTCTIFGNKVADSHTGPIAFYGQEVLDMHETS